MKQNPEKNKTDLITNVKVGQRMQKMARMIEGEIKKAGASKDEVQFSLLIWGPGRSQYVSNANRDDIKVALVELLKRWGVEQDLGVPQMPLGGFPFDG